MAHPFFKGGSLVCEISPGRGAVSEGRPGSSLCSTGCPPPPHREVVFRHLEEPLKFHRAQHRNPQRFTSVSEN